MSALKLSHVWKKRFAGPLHNLVMLSLADNADDYGLVYVPLSRYSEKLQMAEEQLAGVLDELVASADLFRLSARQSTAGYWYVVLPTESDVMVSLRAHPHFQSHVQTTMADFQRLFRRPGSNGAVPLTA